MNCSHSNVVTKWLQSKNWVFLLVLLVVAFALQPCFAAPVQMSAACCGHGHHNGCHSPKPVQICGMRGIVFAPPEHSAPSIPVVAISDASGPEAMPLADSSVIRFSTARLVFDSSGLYLRNSIFLI